MKTVRSVLPAIVMCAISGMVAHAAPPAACGTVNAGFQIITIPTVSGGSQYDGALRVAVWYPTTASAAPYQYWSIISGLVAQNAPITDCGNGTRFPLVVFSHGDTGCGTQTVFYTEELARQGYIVAAPDHQDHGCTIGSNVTADAAQAFNFLNFVVDQSESAWVSKTNYRSVDIDTVVNYMLTTSPWSLRTDPNRLGMSGHSFGGYTTFGKVGGWPQWQPSGYTFQAGLMFSPYIQAFQENSAVINANTPMMFQGGVLDIGITPWVKGPQPGTNQPGAFQQARFPAGGSKYFLELDSKPGYGDSSHFAWVNTICGLSPTTIQACLNPSTGVPNARLIVSYAEAFLDRYVAGQPTASDLALLASGGIVLNTYWRTAGVPGGSYLTGSPAAPNSIAAIKGENLAPTHNVVPNGSLNMPTSINGVTVWVNGMQASLYGIDPAQINFVVPNGLAAGYYTVTAKDSSGNVIATGPISVNLVSPAFFPILPGPDPSNLSLGWAWGWTQQGYAPDPNHCQNIGGAFYCALYDSSAGAAVPVGVAQGNTYLVLAANGLRYASDPQATVGGVAVPVQAAPSPAYQGIDQVNIGPLPASLAGSGQVIVVVTAGGLQSNTVEVVIQ